jgi:putative tryptophan/tyrosine transport system substrate-binding protein
MLDLNRRRAIVLLGGAAGSSIVWPHAARAQQSALPVVGFLSQASADAYRPMLDALREGLQEAGYVEGRNVAIEFRWAEGRTDRLPAMVAELVRRQVAVIAATTTPAAVAAKAANTTIPIVFETGGDPIRLGLVTSLKQPGGNITGATQLNTEVMAKRVELMRELLPGASEIALLLNPTNLALSDIVLREAQAAARSLGFDLHVLNASAESDFDGAFAKLTQLRAAGLVIGADAFLTSQQERLAALALQHAIPAVYENRAFVAAGGLASYGGRITDAYRLAGVYVGRVLKGEKPGDLPVQRATKVEMFLNLKTAKALGVAVPLPLLGRADEVFE